MEEVKVEQGTPEELNVPATAPVEVVVSAEVVEPKPESTEEVAAPEKTEEAQPEVKPEGETVAAPEVVTETEKPATEGSTTSPDAQPAQ